MAKTQSKCAHLPCICVPPEDEKCCTQFCKDAGSEETKSRAIAPTQPAQNEVLTSDRLVRATDTWVECRFPALVTLVRSHSRIRD